jgi:hypothetical protein
MTIDMSEWRTFITALDIQKPMVRRDNENGEDVDSEEEAMDTEDSDD